MSAYTHIEITSIPPGFPPEEIRQHWVGSVIPLADSSGTPVDLNTGQVVTEQSYSVKTLEALKALEENGEEGKASAQWFRDNNIPQQFEKLSFRSSCCKLVAL